MLLSLPLDLRGLFSFLLDLNGACFNQLIFTLSEVVSGNGVLLSILYQDFLIKLQIEVEDLCGGQEDSSLRLVEAASTYGLLRHHRGITLKLNQGELLGVPEADLPVHGNGHQLPLLVEEPEHDHFLLVALDLTNFVLGGLIKEKIARDQNKIPGFGDLPLLGWLFRSKKDQFEKTNLLIFIRPTIIRTKADLEKVNKRASSRFKKAKELNKVSNQVLEDMGLPELSDKAESVTE